MDFDGAVDLLYGMPRDQFIAERDKLAKAEPTLADRIRKLRKPTVAAWEANQLARKRAEDVGALVKIGEDLRAAQQALDGQELRRLSRRRAEALDELVDGDAAAGLRELLETAAVDAPDDLLAGRLVTAPEGGGWGFDLSAPMPTPKPKRASKPEPKPEPKRDLKRDEARKKAQAAVDEATAAEAEAHRALSEAEDGLRMWTERVELLQTELAEARGDRDAVAEDVKQAKREAERRGKALRDAELRLKRL
ncbi:hypothetical protein [Kutzneria buriramensis]|uniref:Uncharacterized protein n=1 Tax=Kutzneria buriramensis TaxID=1045776 RepID=A0A3E0H7C0_9PSEU|nr:hypothetical protein [Kutzneria buriramensis]REH39345.1 hypothetical protein BCF44_113200 [Kutzneria buriramensis]